MHSISFIYVRFFRVLIKYSHKRVRNLHTAESIVSDCFESLCKSKVAFESEEHIKNYLFKSVHNAISSHFREEKRQLHIVDTDINLLDIVEPDPHDEKERQERYALMLEMISRLSPKRRQILMNYFIKGKSVREIASILNIKEATVRSTRRDALEEIRKLLKQK